MVGWARVEPIKRKRVTRVGSGAFSIYLPKKWIDAWPPQQQEAREVDLHQINDALLIVPAIQEARYEDELPDDPVAVQDRLLSSYVRGHRHVCLRPAKDAFGTETQIRARDVLRHTDERIVAEVGPHEIGFTLDAALPAPFQTGQDLMGVLAAKVREVLRLAGEAVDSYATDPERALHALQMLRSVHEEDVARLWHQALRLVATIELPLETVSDFQGLDLAASELHTASGQCLHIAQAILEEWGLELGQLEFPRAHVLQQVEKPGAPPPIVKGMIRVYRTAFDQLEQRLPTSLQALMEGDAARLREEATRCRLAQTELQDRLFQIALDHWGERTPDRGRRAFTASRLAQPVAHILGSVTRMCERAVLLTAARETQAAATRAARPRSTTGMRGPDAAGAPQRRRRPGA